MISHLRGGTRFCGRCNVTVDESINSPADLLVNLVYRTDGLEHPLNISTELNFIWHSSALVTSVSVHAHKLYIQCLHD